MQASNVLTRIREHVRRPGRLWLFLDYDGTLVPIARTPEQARPDADLLALLADLAQAPRFRVAVLSGRPLASLQALLPLPGLTLAGTYGLEVQTAGEVVTRDAAPAEVRPVIERVKSVWAERIGSRPGFMLEDKGLAVALHARWAEPRQAEAVLAEARRAAGQILPAAGFRILGGDRFLEAAPAAAHKGQSVHWLLERMPFPGALVVYFGDDDKDAEAFEVVRRRGGLPIAVGDRIASPPAAERLPAPQAVRGWLRAFLREAARADHHPDPRS